MLRAAKPLSLVGGCSLRGNCASRLGPLPWLLLQLQTSLPYEQNRRAKGCCCDVVQCAVKLLALSWWRTSKSEL